MHKNLLFGLLFGIVSLGMSFPASAQQGQAVSADEFIKEGGEVTQQNQAEPPKEKTYIEKSIEEAKAELENEEIAAKKIQLARAMHQIRPTREQVDSAIQRAATALPTTDRQAFINAMQGMLNYNAIERISMDAMVETYTLKELESMVDYFSKPEAKSASSKAIFWMQSVQPEIIRMIDRAMIRIRTGGN